MALVSAGQIVTAARLNAWLTVSAVRMGATVSRAATQSLPDVSLVVISWDTQTADTDNMWSSGSQVTIPVGGAGTWSGNIIVYLGASVASGALGFVRVLNGSSEIARGRISDNIMSISFTRQMLAGDIITCEVYGDTAAGTVFTAQFDIYRTGP